MFTHPGMHMKSLVAFALTTVTLFSSAAFAQTPAQRSDSQPKEVASSEPKTAKPDSKIAPDETKSNDLRIDIETVKAENVAVRELLRKMEEQQKLLMDQVDRLQRRLDGSSATDVSMGNQPGVPPTTADASVRAANVPSNTPPAHAESARTPTEQASVAATPPDEERYRDGIIIWQTGKDAKVPFLLRFNNNTQLRYLSTLSSKDTFTDHLGNVRAVTKRNDITVNRSMFILGGYIFDERAKYSLTVWTSAGAASIVVAGNIGWQFSKAFTLTAGYTGVPGSRSLVNTFPYYTSTDRSMADNFFRPGFTQGLWANGNLGHGLNYIAFVGNALNSINISAAKIDTHLLTSGSIWWEPFGGYGEPGKSVNMYDDYFEKNKVRIRLGTSFTNSKEDRFSNTDVSNPENTALYNSDGVLTFATGAFAPGVTVDKAKYRMWAMDGGLKYSGFAINGQYFMRWLNDFVADGPLPLTSTFDHGYELSAGHFVIPKKLMIYARGSQIFGQFGNSYEYAGGAKWHFLPTERLWLNAELMRVNKSPYNGAFTPYTSGLNGWVPMVQTIIAF